MIRRSAIGSKTQRLYFIVVYISVRLTLRNMRYVPWQGRFKRCVVIVMGVAFVSVHVLVRGDVSCLPVPPPVALAVSSPRSSDKSFHLFHDESDLGQRVPFWQRSIPAYDLLHP